MKRVLVVGRPAAGKTTFAKALAKKLQLPLVHLDTVYFDPKTGFHAHQAEWAKKINELTRPEKWLIEGAQVVTFGAQAERADTIIFLDYGRHVALSRMARRHLIDRRRVSPEMPVGWREGLESKALAWWLHEFWHFSRHHNEALSQLFKTTSGQQVIILKKPAQARAFLASEEFNLDRASFSPDSRSGSKR